MTTSILNDCLELKDKPLQEIKDYFQTINLITFNAIISKYTNEQEAKQIILFILAGYSEDSPLLILRQDSKEEKEGICEYLQIPEYLQGNLINLTDPDIRKTITAYILQFAGPLFRALKLYEIQLEDLNTAITNREYLVKQKDGKEEDEKEVEVSLYEWKEHSKAVQQFEILSKKKDALERELKSHGSYKAIAEMKEYRFRHLDKKINITIDGVCIENSKRIKIGTGR